jgi:ADP-L-glycero-D-manno-heptose 6-epimerase
MGTLITGAAGFIGKELSKQLKKTGQNVIDCDVSGSGMISSEEIIKDFKSYDIEKISYNNILLTAALSQLAIKNSIPIIYASSASVYGLGTDGFREDSICDPLNYYAISKHSIDLMIRKKIKQNPNSTLIGLRYFNVYGPSEISKGQMASPVYKFLQQASLTGKIKIFYGSEDYKRDFVHIDDVISLTIESCLFPSGIYNIGTGESKSFLEVAKIISRLTGSEIQKIDFPPGLIDKYQQFTCSDNTKINTVSNLKTRLPLEEGIRKVYTR